MALADSSPDAVAVADHTAENSSSKIKRPGKTGSGNNSILIVGGYGVVGHRIASGLGQLYPGRVIIAGRHPERAAKDASVIGYGTRSRAIDITSFSSVDDALTDVAVIISCIDQPGRLVLKAALARGLGYTDITPHLTELGRGRSYRNIDALAKASGARVILGSGIAPGISNVIARALADSLGGADEIETALLLAAGDVSGPASFDYFLQELAMAFNVYVDGKDISSRALSSPRLVDFPAPIGNRAAYLFPFSDQVLYPNTMGVRTAVTRLALEPDWLARALSLVARSPFSRLLGNEMIRHALAGLMHIRTSKAGARFAVRVDVTRGLVTRHASLSGHIQADAAAAGTIELARLLIDRELQEAGAWMPEQVAKPGPFLARLAARGLNVQFSPIDPDRRSAPRMELQGEDSGSAINQG
jgi:saccharopine dehydrogenase (NAD+, L-lysine forming)